MNTLANTSLLISSLETALKYVTSETQKQEIKKIIHQVLIEENFTKCEICESEYPNGEECECKSTVCKNCGFNDCYCCSVCGYRDAYSCYCNNFGQDESEDEETKEICDKCEGNYKCDTGYGENKTRYLENGKCPVCDSDPVNGDHREWFEDYLGWETCNNCDGYKDTDTCKCPDEKCESYDFNDNWFNF